MAEATLQLDGLADEPEDSRMPFLRRFARSEKVTERQDRILSAHGLTYDPHVDGRKRLTPRGRELLAEEGA